MSILTDAWLPKDGFEFEANALTTIKSSRNIALMAGPGAGKTEVLAQRACFLLETGVTLWPKNILAITRKRESATNIKQRVELRCGKVLSERFHSYTIEAFTKNILDRFMSVLPEDRRPDFDYEIKFNPQHAVFPQSLSFDHITGKAQEIVQLSPVLVKAIRATYSHVFIDEFQDLNEIQYNFIKLLFENTDCILTVVGDTKQAIMKFANALPDVFERFENDFNAQVLPLYINYRSSPELRSFLGRLALIWWPSPAPVIESLHLSSDIHSICCYQNEAHEAKELALMIQKWIINDGILPHEIAILFRVNSQNNYSKNISSELSSINILSINESQLQDHLSEPIGKILLSLLILLTRHRDAEAWEILSDLYLLSRGYFENDQYETQKLEILSFIDSNSARFDDAVSTGEFLYHLVIEFFEMFFGDHLEATWPQYLHGDLASMTLKPILDELINIKNADNTWKESVDLISGINAVRMMTIHKSKGLEFEAVILLGFEDYSFFRFGANNKKLDEEKSTIFVALSRAKERLWISSSINRIHYGNSTFGHIKPLINDITGLGLNKAMIKM